MGYFSLCITMDAHILANPLLCLKRGPLSILPKIGNV